MGPGMGVGSTERAGNGKGVGRRTWGVGKEKGRSWWWMRTLACVVVLTWYLGLPSWNENLVSCLKDRKDGFQVSIGRMDGKMGKKARAPFSSVLAVKLLVETNAWGMRLPLK